MKFKNSQQLKALIDNKSIELYNTPKEAIRQNVMMEHFIRRLSLSKHKDNFIIKGGVLVSSLVGINNRATMDLDTTIKNFFLSSDNLKEILEEICNMDLEDGFKFSIEKIDGILQDNVYPGIRVHMMAYFDRTRQPLKIDVTTADIITPHEIEHELPSLFSDPIKVKAYPLETILAEKLETILARDIANTRMRDFYDVGALCDIQGENINYNTLFVALKNTAVKRGSLKLLNNYENILETIKNNKTMKQLWENYSKEYKYAEKYTFTELCEKTKAIFKEIYTLEKGQASVDDLIARAVKKTEKSKRKLMVT